MKISLLADHPQHVNIIAQWYYNEWAHMSPDVTEKMVREKVAAKAINRDQIPFAIVVHEGEKLVGVAELKFRENDNYTDYEHWLGGVFVEPTMRGRGVANLLVSDALKRAEVLGVGTLYLQCELHNVSLYKRHGFNVLHRVVSDDIATTIMAWSSNDDA